MRISPEALEEFKAIYKSEFGMDLTDAEALDKAIPLLNLMKAVYKPITVEDVRRFEERKAELRTRKAS